MEHDTLTRRRNADTGRVTGTDRVIIMLGVAFVVSPGAIVAMPSPFPGMDPYIEIFEWEDFHTRILPLYCDAIEQCLPPGYLVRFQRRSYVELDLDYDAEMSPPDRVIVPDLTITPDSSDDAVSVETSVATLTLEEPLHQRLPQPIERRETYLEIKDLRTRDVITAIEFLSPSNKRAGTEGGRLYAKKRRAVLESRTHFVELDLLRGGQRILLAEPGMPRDHDYYAFVSRADQRPKIELYTWRLRDRLPAIRIPLKPEHGFVPLDLQSALNQAYDRACYQHSIDDHRPLLPPIRPTDDTWFQSVIESVASQSQPNT